MFNSLEEAIKFGEESQKRDNDGGVPVFEKRAVAKRVGEDVEWVDEYWVKVFNKGDPKNIMEMSVTEAHKKRWPEQWKAFLNNEEPDIDGIPLDDFPKLTPAERQRCKSLHLRSVEDLVNYPDGQIKDLGARGHTIKNAAREFLDYANGTTVTDLKMEIAQLKKELQSVTNGTSNNSERGDGDKLAQAIYGDDRGSRPSGSGSTDSIDNVQKTGEEGLAGSGEGTRVQPGKESIDV